MTPEAEEAMVGRMLRHQVGIDPDRLDQVLDLAAVGIVNSTWRNSPVEDWHAGTGPLDDGDMLRINAYTTWRVRRICRRWRADVGLRRDSDADILDELHADDLDWLAVRIFRWMTDPKRRLPIGVTLGELAGAGLSELVDHVDLTLGSMATTAERYGVRHALWKAAAHGGLACRHWWGTPTWPATVFAFLAALDDLHHPPLGS